MDSKEVRRRIKESGMKHWQVAAKLGIGEATLVRWLRQEELTAEQQQKILGILKTTERG